MSDRVTISISDGIADVRFDRVDKRNALDGEMFAAIAAAGERLKNESAVRVVVVSGNGPSFCAGLDFSTFESMAGGDTADTPRRGNPGQIEPGQIAHLGQQVAWVWQEVPVPVIAAVHGHALAGGLPARTHRRDRLRGTVRDTHRSPPRRSAARNSAPRHR
jgi:enoyl-CoA hydratase/carnithine racemase